jgi:hypothetical protein
MEEAVSRPDVISEVYRQFHDYSVGNILLALFQCYERHLQPGPIATYVKWKELGRHVKRGEKAIALCMPVTAKRKKKPVPPDPLETEAGKAKEPDECFTIFVFRPHWFVLSQTEGEPYQVPELPEWDKYLALKNLDIKEIPFECLDGNTLGYARRREVAVSLLSPFP